MFEKTVTIFGSAVLSSKSPEYQQAKRLGILLARNGWRVCSGGYGGVMEAVSRGASEALGRVAAVTLKGGKLKANPWVGREIRVASWQARLFRLIDEGDAYVVMDGGTGTMVELFVVWEMMNKFKMDKTMLVLGRRKHALLRFLEKHPLVKTNGRILKIKTPEEAVLPLQQALRMPS
ncbi:MAG: LOG family protein [Candidatus Omnitrophota bacterium]|jgi:hypothetical protein